MKRSTIFFISILLMTSCDKNESSICLSGEWAFALDSADIGIIEKWHLQELPDKITLPGTTDDAGKGIPNTLSPSLEKPQILHLTRRNSYIGPAWYKKEVLIPSSWKDKNIYLNMERVIWETSVWVDGVEVRDKEESLVAPHRYDLTKHLSPGKHTLSLRIDNRKKHDISINDMGHAYTNETQIMWNGVLGDLSLTAEEPLFIKRVAVYPDIKQKNIRIKVNLSNSGDFENARLTASVRLKGNESPPGNITNERIALDKGEQVIEMIYPMGDSFLLWSEFSPNVYELTIGLETDKFQSSKYTTFGMRELKQENAEIRLNGKRVFMRGTLECCVFPLTGYPPMDKPGWAKVMRTAREWGLNHLRFHSWCPPKAAFEVADELGLYLQIELPLWSLNVGEDSETNQFLYKEADRIIEAYGNHPSFCFFSMGNELQSDFDFLRNLMASIKEKDPRHLYTTTSFTFEKGHGLWPEPDDDFFITQWTKNGWIRGQGIFDLEAPCFNKDYTDAMKEMTVPLITHEIGQYAVFPNLKEIEKYTGILDPLNFKGVKIDLEKKGLIHKAGDYLQSSGKLAALLYKEEIERTLKTHGCSGFQLLDLHDFPGQGTALVGLLDAFWESKELISSSEFRQFCAPVVPLIRYPKATYTSSETFNATIEIANYGGEDLNDQNVSWYLKDSRGNITAQGSIDGVNISTGGNGLVGGITCPLNKITKADELTLTVSISNTTYSNSWKIWVYPEFLDLDKRDIIITRDKDEAEKALKMGKKVLFNPRHESLIGLEGKFLPVFWSPVHFPKQAGSMGILCNPDHAAFKHFPTRMHTDWQWWHLLTASKTLIIDCFYQDVTPIVECIDNFANNRRLTILFEAKCEHGMLIVSSMDLLDSTSTSPEKRQLLYSLIEYMNSAEFTPESEMDFEKIASLIDPAKGQYKRASAESIY